MEEIQEKENSIENAVEIMEVPKAQLEELIRQNKEMKADIASAIGSCGKIFEALGDVKKLDMFSIAAMIPKLNKLQEGTDFEPLTALFNKYKDLAA